jgi:tRNA (guanine37-N1)-methyltransferase
MVISILTLFPQIFQPLLESSILAKAQKQGKLRANLIDLRKFGIGKYRQVDDRVYGGGVGMVLRIEPIAKAIEKSKIKDQGSKIILLTPQGKTFNQKTARRLSKEKHLILICGKYEGVDERVRNLVDEEISIGDYILSGGEIAAMAVVDAIARLLPGVLEKEATRNESFSPLLEPPQYTRPEKFEGMKVPKILLSGNHQEIARWRVQEALKKTKKLRPDLLKD